MVDKLRRYGQWAGNEAGVLEDTTKCVKSVYPEGRSLIPHQCRFKRRPGSEWCGTHSPEAKQRRKEKSEEGYRKQTEAWTRQQNAIPDAEAQGVKRGIEAAAEWHEEMATHLRARAETTKRDGTGLDVPHEDRVENYKDAAQDRVKAAWHDVCAESVRKLKA